MVSGISNVEMTKQQLKKELTKAYQKISKLEEFYSGIQDADEYKNLAIQVLKLSSGSSQKINLIRKLLLLIKDFTGFTAVGIRLREGEDFPYYETNGFPNDFVEAERHLCSYNEEGGLIRDSKGNVLLECMCGNIICGRINPSLPFFTDGGSFWTNSTTDLLASTTEDDRQAHTLNYCNGQGYESVALFPLQSGSEIIGLLQLNDFRKNMFSLRMVKFLEGIVTCFGIVIKIKEHEEALIRARDEFELKVEERTRELVAANKKLKKEIIERKLAEEQTRKDLKEKEILLAEVHHRVKNNMQIISSLINLQLHSIDDKITIERLNECKSRIRSMALIHERLYQSKEFASIDIVDYIQRLTNELSSSYRVHHTRVELKMSMQRVNLRLDRAIPLGLVINELVSNIFKHAFPASWKGDAELSISLKEKKENEIILIIQDNGVGLPPQMDTRKTGSLGLHIVNILVEDQLDGKLKIERKNGTKYSIRFKK